MRQLSVDVFAAPRLSHSTKSVPSPASRAAIGTSMMVPCRGKAILSDHADPCRTHECSGRLRTRSPTFHSSVRPISTFITVSLISHPGGGGWGGVEGIGRQAPGISARLVPIPSRSCLTLPSRRFGRSGGRCLPQIVDRYFSALLQLCRGSRFGLSDCALPSIPPHGRLALLVPRSCQHPPSSMAPRCTGARGRP